MVAAGRWLVLGALSACGFHGTVENAIDGGHNPITCTAVGATCSGSTLHTCSAVGEPSHATACAWGCLELDVPHCGVLVPSGGAVQPDHLEGDGLTPKGLAGTLDSTTGAISGIRGPGAGVIAGIDFEVRSGVGIFRFAALTIDGSLVLGGSNAVALVSLGDIEVAAIIDARGDCVGPNAGPGGARGGARATTAAGPGGGAGGTGPHDNSSGGGGGGHGVAGARGGKSAATSAPPGGPMFGNPEIAMLRGGGGGGGGGGPTGGDGGGGGGGVQLIANGKIQFAAASGINASGCGGAGSTGDSGGGGGGGGAILLEASSVALADDSGLVVNGGGGGGADPGQRGSPGTFSPRRALGGSGTAAGGDGGAAAGAATAGTSDQNSGGGGGGPGWIRINTPTGSATLGSALLFSPALGTTATQGRLRIQ